MNATKKAKARILQSLRVPSRANEESSSLIAARVDVLQEKNEIRPEDDATSANEPPYENTEIEHDDNFDEHKGEDDDSNANAFRQKN